MDNPDTTTNEKKASPRQHPRRWRRRGKIVLLGLLLFVSYGLIAMWRDAPRAEWLRHAVSGSTRCDGETSLSPAAVRLRNGVIWCKKLPFPFAKPITSAVYQWVLSPFQDRFLVSHEICFRSGIALTELETNYLSQSQTVTTLTLPHAPLGKPQIADLSRMTWLKRLDCFQPLQAEDLTTLFKHSSHLEHLLAFVSSLDAESAKTLFKLNSLQTLILQAPFDQIPKELSIQNPLPQLSALSLIGPVSGDCEHALPFWLHSRNLRFVSLTSLPVSSKCMQKISDLPQIHILEFPACRLEAESLADLANCPQLTQLYLQSTNLDDSAIPVLNKLTNLTFLSLQDTKITLAGIQQLKLKAKLRLDPSQDPLNKMAKTIRPALTTNLTIASNIGRSLFRVHSNISSSHDEDHRTSRRMNQAKAHLLFFSQPRQNSANATGN